LIETVKSEAHEQVGLRAAPRESHDREPAAGSHDRQIRQEPPPSTRSLRRFGMIALAIALLIAVGGVVLRWIHERDVTRWTNSLVTPIVTVLAPERGVTGVQTVLPGDVQAWYEAPLYARVNGYLKNWYVDYGAHVKKGQVLADIDAPDLDADLAAAAANLKSVEAQVNVREAEMEFAKTTYERWRDSPKGVVSVQEQEAKKADFGSAKARYNAALADVNSDRGAVDRLKALEQFKRIVAPFDGTVTSRTTDIGALINAGSNGTALQLFRVADVHEMRVFVQVPQEMSAGIHIGLVADLNLPQYPGREFKATVATTSQAINQASRTLLVELHADNKDGLLQPGTYAEVHFELPGNPAMVRIPTSALVFRQDGMQVAVLGAGNQVELRPVTLGRNLGTDVEVLTGLAASDRVIDSPPDSLATGDLVRVANEPRGALAKASAAAAAGASVARENPPRPAPAGNQD
jgi:RND family efflux transporter MFP subunit